MFKQRSLRIPAIVAAAACMTLGAGATGAQASTDTLGGTSYTVTSGAVVQHGNAIDSPANPFIDKNGTFYFQQSIAQYYQSGPRKWTSTPEPILTTR